MKYLYVKNWEKFQHYKDRNPPWIKLHRDLLRDYEFTCLQDASKLLLMLLWLLASQLDNKIPHDLDWLKTQLGINKKPDLKELIKQGFIVVDSNVLADCKRLDIVEAETEAYKEEEDREKNKNKYGIADNIILSKDEYQKLTEKLKSMRDEYIDRLSVWKDVDKYKSHYLTILKWWKKDGSPTELKPKQNQKPKPSYDTSRGDFGMAVK
jgi:hypothetical protein